MIITVFVFLGIEGASVYSRYAKRRQDVGRATVLGFLSVMALFAMVSLFPYAVLPREEIAGLRQPSMAPVLASVVGNWGAVFISIGVVVSVLGAYLAWTLMAAEVLYIPATNDDMPRFLKRENKAKTPIWALILSSSFVQLMLVVVLFAEDALNFMLDLCTSLSLIPYFLSAAYALKIAIIRETYEVGDRGAHEGARDRHRGGDLHAFPSVRRRAQVLAVFVHHLRLRHCALRNSPTGELAARIPAVGAGAVRFDHRRSDHRHHWARDRQHHHLTAHEGYPPCPTAAPPRRTRSTPRSAPSGRYWSVHPAWRMTDSPEQLRFSALRRRAVGSERQT
jgi:hypothetical protein